MKKWGTLILVLGVFVLMPLANAQDDAPFFEHPDALSARYVEEKFLPTLSRPVRSEGNFIYIRDKGIAWLMDTPFVMHTIITPEGIFQRIDGETLKQSDAAQRAMKPILKHIAAIFSGDEAALSEHFEILNRAEKDGLKTTMLTPKSGQLKPFLQGIEISGHNYINTVKIVFSTDKYTVIRYSNPQSGLEFIDEKEQRLFDEH